MAKPNSMSWFARANSAAAKNIRAEDAESYPSQNAWTCRA